MANQIASIEALKVEASRYKTVRVSWLVAQLDRILAGGEPAAPVQVHVIHRLPRPVTLLRFLAQVGGLAPHGELRAMNAERKFVPGAGMLVRRDGEGMTLDRAREAAEQAGYLQADSEINDLLDAISEELHGRPRYRAADAHHETMIDLEARYEAEMAAEAVGETAFSPYEAVNAECPF